MSTKTRRPMATPSSKTAATPKRKPAANSGAASKKAVLDNFDLEGEPDSCPAPSCGVCTVPDHYAVRHGTQH